MAPEGDVSDDVVDLKVLEEQGKPDSATVVLDTSERPHALEERKDIQITITDQNTTEEFSGFVDSVKDDPERPTVTVDARTEEGRLDDATAAGVIDEDNLFDVIDAVVDSSAGRVRGITFDPAPLIDKYGTFANSTDFGTVDIAHYPQFGVDRDSFEQHETASQNTAVELRISSYTNTTEETYVADFTGQDSNGDTVKASLDLPPADSATDAFGADTIRLALSGGAGKWTSVSSITTNIPSLSVNQNVGLGGSIWNHVKTDWEFRPEDTNTVRDAIGSIVAYLSGLDAANDWRSTVTNTGRLVVEPEADSATPDRHVFREGDNVLKPVASRDLDGVRNFIKVSGAGQINVWAWAWDGNLQWASANPFTNDYFPNNGITYGASPAPQNDIDNIDLRAEPLSSRSFTSVSQAEDIAKEALSQYLRTPVSGQAPVAGIHPADPGDEAEVYYPSRGIPAKVASNIFRVKKVEYSITPDSATTTIDWGSSERNLGDIISGGSRGGGGSGASTVRTDISNTIKQYSGSQQQDTVVVGTLNSENDDGTWEVSGENGVLYDGVDVI